jgi:hypothetical protein
MTKDSIFQTETDYSVPLLQLLSGLPGGQGRTAEVCNLFKERYDHRIPDEHRDLRSSGEPIWRNDVRWCRQNLKQQGLLDAPRHGVWRISEAGRRWLKEHPSATRIEGAKRAGPRTSRRQPSRTASSALGISLEMLEETRKLMPADQFRQLWGKLYDQLLAEERAKAITEITQTELGRRTRRWLDEVHAFLKGKIVGLPSSEVLCDWIHFCYVLQLHREAAALLPYVREDEVDVAIYTRARRVAEVCRSKLAG